MKSETHWGAWSICALIGLISVWAANRHELWYGVMVVGFFLGMLITRKSVALLLSWVSGIGGWGLSLLSQSLHTPVDKAASVLSRMMGLDTSDAGIVILITLILAALLAICGFWIGTALRRLFIIRESRMLQ